MFAPALRPAPPCRTVPTSVSSADRRADLAPRTPRPPDARARQWHGTAWAWSTAEAGSASWGPSPTRRSPRGGESSASSPTRWRRRRLRTAALTELIVVAGMHERRRLMASRSSGLLTLPGGVGTYEEFFEILTWAGLGLHRKPIGVLNVEGYFDPLLARSPRPRGRRAIRPARAPRADRPVGPARDAGGRPPETTPSLARPEVDQPGGDMRWSAPNLSHYGAAEDFRSHLPSCSTIADPRGDLPTARAKCRSIRRKGERQDDLSVAQ